MSTSDTRGRVLDAAFDEIAQVGIRRLVLEDVAARAGVSRQTVYRHFGSREGLIESLVRREERWFSDRAVAAAQRATSGAEAVAAAVTEALHAAAEHALLRRLLETEPGEILPLVVLGRGPVISAARPVVMRILADGLGWDDDDARVAADVCSRLMVSYVLDPGDESAEATGWRIAGIVVGGLGAMPRDGLRA